MARALETKARAQDVRASRETCAMKLGRIVAITTLGILVASCAATAQSGRASSTAAVSTRATVAPAPAPPAPRDAEVAVEVRAPVRARYDASVLGAEKPWLGVVVTNRSARPIDVSDLRVYLEAAREGIAFRCARVVGAKPGDREPTALAPGETFVFDRALDCALPLVGAYAVHVGVSFGNGEWSRPHEVRAFNLAVTALPSIAPREIEGRPGLWAAMGSSSKLLGGARGGHGRTVLAVVNATRAPIEPPHMRLALRVYKQGNPIPCEDEPLTLALPEVLGPGETYYEPIEISCLGLSVAGTYDVAARLIVPRGTEGDREISIGRLRVDVVTDPSLPNPRLWREPVP
jgi:hypothetical protein